MAYSTSERVHESRRNESYVAVVVSQSGEYTIDGCGFAADEVVITGLPDVSVLRNGSHDTTAYLEEAILGVQFL